jgi:ABC-2 type transport system permease protein
VRNVLLLFMKDFKRKWKNPVVIIGFMLIPFLFTFIFGMVFGSSEEEALPQVKVLAVDQDRSFLSEFLLTALTQGELKNMIDLRKVEEEEGRKLLDKGKASALILIPENFGADVWEGKPREILLLKNPSEQFLPQIVEEISDVATLLFSSLFSVFSGELTTIKGFIDEGKVPDADISSLSVQLKDRVEGISKYIFPPVISLKQETIKEEGETDESGITVYNYILPAMAIMFLLFICNVVFEDVLKEKEQGTLLRLSVSPMRLSEFVWSKILTSALIGMICTSALILLGRFVYSISWGNPFLVLSIIICLNILLAGFIALLYSFVKTERQAGALTSSVIIVMALLGGSMMPVENFPPLIQKFSKLTVNYWGLEAFKMAILREPVRQVLPILVGMTVAGIVFASVSSYFLQNNLKKGLLK